MKTTIDVLKDMLIEYCQRSDDSKEYTALKDAIEKLEELARLQGIVDRIDEFTLRGISAQGYCTKRNGNKTVDPDLLYDIVKAICKYLKGEK